MLLESCSFEKVHMDCDGSWTVCIQNDVTRELSDFKIHILTMVEMATNWQELSFIPTAKYCSCTKQFNLCWLCLFPCPNTVRHHNTSSNKLPKRMDDMVIVTALKRPFSFYIIHMQMHIKHFLTEITIETIEFSNRFQFLSDK